MLHDHVLDGGYGNPGLDQGDDGLVGVPVRDQDYACRLEGFEDTFKLMDDLPVCVYTSLGGAGYCGHLVDLIGVALQEAVVELHRAEHCVGVRLLGV